MGVACDAELRLLAQVHELILLVVEEYVSSVFLHDVDGVEDVLLVPAVPHQHLLLLQLREHGVEVGGFLVQYFGTHFRNAEVEDIGVNKQIGDGVDGLEDRLRRFGGRSKDDHIRHHLGGN